MYQNLLTFYEIACCTSFMRSSDTLLVLMLLLILMLIQMHQQEDVDAEADPEAGANNLQ
jgi:hypothetical protein